MTFTRPVNPRRLLDEVLAVPGVVVDDPNAPVIGGVRSPISRVSMLTKPDNSEVTLHADDLLDQSVLDALTAVVNAHDGTPNPVPDSPDFGTDVPDNFQFQLANAVSNLRQYLTIPTPTAAQSAAALKTTIRVLLYLVRKQTG